MKLTKISLQNFRGYKNKTDITFTNGLTAITGRNDVGKSTILEALEIFFNNKTVKIDPSDKSVFSDSNEVTISCTFDSLPAELIIDDNYPTSYSAEYLLNSDGHLEIHKKYTIQKTITDIKTFIHCKHPTVEPAHNLHQLKLADLKKIGTELGIEPHIADKRVASLWRQAIWQSIPELKLANTDINLSDLEKESKAIQKNIESELPVFALFKSDRESVDDDPEAKNPMQVAVDQAKKSLQAEIDSLQAKIEAAVLDVAERTKDKLREMDPALASELTPRFKEKPKWTFAFTLDGEGGIPINKRGSGVRRLILLNFFRAEAEKKKSENNSPNVIYAIEEPETSQHPNYQIMLVDSLLRLASRTECQIILTTHVPALAGLVPIDALRFIEKDDNGIPIIHSGGTDTLEKVATTLGVLPESEIASAKAVLLVEGHSDVTFVTHSANTLKAAGIIKNNLIELGIAAIPIGGCGNLKHWVTKRLIDQLGLDWAVLLDSDAGDPHNSPKNKASIDDIIKQGKMGFLTRKREPENYLDPHLFQISHGITITYSDTCDAKSIIATALTIRKEDVLEKHWPKMTAEQITKQSEYLENGVVRYEIFDLLTAISTLTKKQNSA